MQQKYTVKKTVTYYAEVTAETEAQALYEADLQGYIELDADAVESDWEIVVWRKHNTQDRG